MTSSPPIIPLDLKETLAENRLVGLWRLLRGYYIRFITANIAVAVSAFSRTATYMLIGFYVDKVLGTGATWTSLLLVALAFVGLALVQGSSPSSAAIWPRRQRKASPCACATTSTITSSG
jgi:hypothetical protein